MECSGCSHENREGTRFCVECGTPLALRCPECSSECAAGQKFCGECGTPLTGTSAPGPAAGAAPSAVRKTVTVLFADLGGSTGFGERVDPEISRQVLAQYHALLQAVVDDHDGTVAKFMGDGMMATFGIPEVAEDDARRAVDAGAAMQLRFRDFAAEIERRYRESLTLRVGINTGEVVIGDGDADLIGDALNVAARLEKECRPGRVLVGEETWRLTRGEVGYESLGDVTVAGRAQPVAIFEVAAEVEAGPEVAAPFVGRDDEMQRLIGAFEDARAAGRARLVTVLGSPGVGKTRLSRELCARLADDPGAQSVELRCDRAGEATFAPVAQLIRDASGITDDLDADAARAAIGTLLPPTDTDHARVVDVLAGLVGVGPARSVEETFWGVRRLVEATAATRPLVVVIDDIQWAEPLLLDLIEHLAEWVADAAVLVVGLARPELREVRPSLAEPGRPVAAVVVLDGLDASATEALAAGLLGTDHLPSGLVERLPESTDGNPLFVRELVRMLVDDRIILRRGDGEWELTIDAEAVDVPPTIQSLLGARVERLPAAEREVLEFASVVGAEFSLGALRELAGEREAVDSLLERMRRKELVEPTGTYWGDEPVHRFHHVLIRDAAYRRLLKTTRAELHARVAVWTDRTAADLVGEHETATAFHYEQAFRYRTELGTVDDDTVRLGRRAAELLTIAAQSALGRDDLAAAGAASARALTLLPESDAAARADLLQMACECLLASGDGAAARPLVEELGRSSTGDPRLAAWADCFAAQLVGLTDPEGLVAADARARAAAETLTDLGDGSGQAKAHQVRAGLLARLGRVGDAELELDLALAAARAADDRRRVTAVLGAAPDAALFGPSPVARAGGRCLDVVRLLRITTASPAVEAASHRCQAVLESLRGRFDVSRSMLASARASLEELGLRHGLAQTELYAGMVELIAGNPHGAVAPLRAAYEGLGTLGVGADAGQAAALLSTALLAEGEVDEAELMAAESEALAGQNLKTAIGWRVARAEVLAARGDVVSAVALAEEAVAIAAGTDLVIDHADACVSLATLRAQSGDAAGARAARADAKRLYDQKGATVPAERLEEAGVASEPAPAPQPIAAADAPEVDVAPAVTAQGPALENAASRVEARFTALLASGADRELGELIAPEFVFEDRRSVVNFGVSDRSAAAAHLDWSRRDGQEFAPPVVIAIRGDRLALSRRTQQNPNGFDRSSLGVAEIDEAGRWLALVQFDESDLDAAIEELDARYVAGEGADHAELVATTAAWLRAMNAFDFDAMRALATPAFVYVDHRQMGAPPLDFDDFIRWQETYRDVIENGFVAVDLCFHDRVSLVTAVNRAVDVTGGELLWSFRLVSVVGPDGRTTRTEAFGAEDLDAAVARFEELRRAENRPPFGNVASRVHQRVVDAIDTGDDDTLAALVAPGFVFEDRRHVVNFGVNDAVDSAAQVAWLRDEGYTMASVQVLAVRGEHLALTRNVTRTPTGDEIAILALTELDAQERFLGYVQFDEEARDAAVAELDARYVAGEGGEHADLMRVSAEWMRALDDVDLDALRGVADPDFVLVDRRALSWPTVDLDGFIDIQRAYGDIESRFLTRAFRARGRTVLLHLVNEAVDADGGAITWEFGLITVVTPEGRVARAEIFADEDRDSALARFDELSTGPADPRTPELENSATRTRGRILEQLREARFEEAGALLTEDFERVDRRSVVSMPDSCGRAAFVASSRATYDAGFTDIRHEPIAVRGDRLELSRVTARSQDGHEIVFLNIGEVDGTGRACRTTSFDEEDLAAAIAELDARYVAGEGAEHAELIRRSGDFIRSMGAVDGAATLALMHPDIRFTDHRALGLGALRFDGVRAVLAARAEDTVADRSYFCDLVVRGSTAMGTVWSASLGSDGEVAALSQHRWIVRWVAGRMHDADWFDLEEVDATRARFDELVAAPPPVELDNACVRAVARIEWLAAFGYQSEAADRIASGIVSVDHRSAMGDGLRIEGRDAFVENRADIRSDPGSATLRNEWVAVRGERHALAKVTWTAEGGSEAACLATFAIDEDSRLCRSDWYDLADLATAIDDLEAQYRAGEGAQQLAAARARFEELGATSSSARTPIPENAVTRMLLVSQRRREARDPDFDLGAGLATDVSFEDRRSGVSLPELRGVDRIRDNMAAQDESFGPTDFEPVAVRGDHLALVSTRSTSESGFELTSLMVFETDDADRVRSMVSFDSDDLAAALEELDARYAASGSAAGIEIAFLAGASALNRRDYPALEAVLAPDFVSIDHQPLGFPPVGRREFVDDHMAGLDAMVPDNVRVVTKLVSSGPAVLAVIRVIGTNAGGGRYEWTPVFVMHFGADGRVDRNEAFPPEEWDAALARFDELAAEATALRGLTNRAVRTIAGFPEAFAARDWDRITALYHDEMVNDDRRRAVSSGETIGRDSAVELIRSFADVGISEVGQEVVAVRGDRLALVRRTWHRPDGFEIPVLSLMAFDADDRMVSNTMWDVEDLALAVAELDRRDAERETRDSDG